MLMLNSDNYLLNPMNLTTKHKNEVVNGIYICEFVIRILLCVCFLLLDINVFIYIALIHCFRFMSDTRNPRVPSCGPQILFLPQCVWPSVHYGSHGLLQSFQEPELFNKFHVLYLQYVVSSM